MIRDTTAELLDIHPYTGERAVPWNRNTGTQVMVPHAMRYAWALQWCYQKQVADLGCGVGYGSFMLSWMAKHVIGVDIDIYSIQYAGRNFSRPQVSFEQGDVTTAIPPADVYVCFECLEHLQDPHDVLRLVGTNTLIWSIPVNDGSRYHVRPYSTNGIHSIMQGSQFWYQHADGLIVPKHDAPFKPTYILGVK
jgi:SAM-dependent methyltransferase